MRNDKEVQVCLVFVKMKIQDLSRVISALLSGSWAASCKSVKSNHALTLYTHKKNSTRFQELNRRHDTIKLLEENIGKTFCNINSRITLGSARITKTDSYSLYYILGLP